MAGSPVSESDVDSTPAHKDRSVALVVFGVLQILIGACCAALIPLSLVARAVGRAGGVESGDAGSVLSAMAVYAVMATTFVGRCVRGQGSGIRTSWSVLRLSRSTLH